MTAFSDTKLPPYKLFERQFQAKTLKEIYDKNFRFNTSKGVDRLNGVQFGKQADQQIKVIRKKCLRGSYKFSPYLELLHSKGRGKPPRLLAIPTVRDRIVLYGLKEILAQVFSDCVPHKLANTYVHEIGRFAKNRIPSEMGVYRADIENFYGSVDRDKLFEKLRKRIRSKKILFLIRKAIEAPIVPANHRRKSLGEYFGKSEARGLPQGLCISNILASIYLHDFDRELEKNNLVDVYYRYVDDILIFSKQNNIADIEKLVQKEVGALNLNLSIEKTYKKTGEEAFEYLGYHFELPRITIKSSTVDKFLHSIAGKFSNYLHSREKQLERFSGEKAQEKLQEKFIFELNEKITGAISENKKYGWIFYFNAINDISVLYKIDKVISGFFRRLSDFKGEPPKNLKKVVKAFYEAKYNPIGGYIHNYNNYITTQQKRDFLGKIGWLEPNKGYFDREIIDLYERAKQLRLSYLLKDDAVLY